MDTVNDADIIYADLDLSPGGSAPNPSEDKTVYTDIAVFQHNSVQERQGLQFNINEEVEMTTQSQPSELSAPEALPESPPRTNCKHYSKYDKNVFHHINIFFRRRARLLG